MADEITVRLARVEEAGSIVGLIRGSFTPELRNAMIYGSRGIESYLERQIAAPAGLSDTVYLVAAEGDRVAGCVELRWLAEALFLNYICCDPRARSKGLARKLLAESIRLVRTVKHRDMLLDVFENNLPARNWYERLGFSHRYSTRWWEVPVPVPGGPGAGKLSGYPQALASQQAYGFSQFRLMTATGEYAVGCLGEGWFRVSDPALLSDPEALALLGSIDAKRRILALLPEAGLPVTMPAGSRPIVTSWRMAMDLDELLGKLAD